MQEMFRKFSNKVSDIAGSVYAFGVAGVVILCWAVTGPIFKFSDTWQLIINTGTTIVTFLMVFLIQNTQNRDNTALHAKLDELIVHTVGARNKLAMASLALFVLIVVVSLLAPFYANHLAKTDPFSSNLTGTTNVNGKEVEVVQQTQSGLGLGVIPIGPTWHSRFLLGADDNGRDIAVTSSPVRMPRESRPSTMTPTVASWTSWNAAPGLTAANPAFCAASTIS